MRSSYAREAFGLVVSQNQLRAFALGEVQPQLEAGALIFTWRSTDTLALLAQAILLGSFVVDTASNDRY